MKQPGAMSPAVFIAGFLIIDMNVAWSGGYSAVLGIIPVPQIGVLLAAGSAITLLIRAIALCYQRKFGSLCIFVICVAALLAYCDEDRRQRVAKGHRDALNAVNAMLKNPDKEHIWYLKPELKQELRAIVDASAPEAHYKSSFHQFFTYRYSVQDRNGKALDITVFMLKDETQFRVDRSDMATTGQAAPNGGSSDP
ncbi:hypothetical protein F2P44_07120 [Massilia sp. CCM 8695]|uniref:Uncharacterized protein n=1 Tax=Massilia frigida TaxID=2609281 RepID=A0ABX0N711_9BURK|nr:hypothetical protein [Massilia frigida]NHZ79046.1 hypothetical protein [Massilia frigida]